MASGKQVQKEAGDKMDAVGVRDAIICTAGVTQTIRLTLHSPDPTGSFTTKRGDLGSSAGSLPALMCPREMKSQTQKRQICSSLFKNQLFFLFLDVCFQLMVTRITARCVNTSGHKWK